MTDEIAKKLKDAGFPQPSGAKGSYVPALAEIIKACGDRFWNLRRTPEGRWMASGRVVTKENKMPYFETALYDEPEIAAVELFLAIKLHEEQ